MKNTIALFLSLVGFTLSVGGYSQSTGKKIIETYLGEKKFDEARTELETQLQLWFSSHNLDSLATYPWYVGMVEKEFSNTEAAVNKVQSFTDTLKILGANPRQMHTALMSFVSFLDDVSLTQRSFDTNLAALKFARVMGNATPEEIGFTEYNLGVSAWRLGNYQLARSWLSTALKNYESYDQVSLEKLADGYNAMGAMMWLTTSLDSAQYYYNRSVATVSLLDTDTISKAYRTAITLANVALIEQTTGRTSKAISTLENVLRLYQLVIRESDDDFMRNRSIRFQWRSMSNLAAFYNAVGNYQLANQMLEYVYGSMRDVLPPGDREIYSTLIRIGESQMSLREYRKANETFKKALELIDQSDGDNLYWRAIALSNLAQTEDELGNPAHALQYFRESIILFEKSLSNRYDRYYLFALSKMASFLASNEMGTEAVALARKTHDYVLKTAGNDNILVVTHKLNLAEIFHTLDNHTQALEYSKTTLDWINERLKDAESVTDTFQLTRQKPQVLVLQVKTLYHSTPRELRDSVFLLDLYKQLQQGMEVMDRRRTLFPANENITALLDENQNLIEWLKKISFDLYLQTGNPVYLGQLIDHHENGIFQKIRLRFHLKNNNEFAHVPHQILDEEFRIMQSLSQLLSTTDASPGEQFAALSQLQKERELFLEMLSREYPEYYNMRYGAITGTLHEARKNLQPDHTIVQYMFILDELKAIVITKENTRIHNLDFTVARDLIPRLNTFIPEKEELQLLHQLYNVLWKPLEAGIQTKEITLIPDGVLYNLSFETLVTAPIERYQQMAGNILLIRHPINYNFSLAMQGLTYSRKGKFKNSYVAFVPGFTREMKSQYESLITGTSADDSYLQMLPQPFAINVAGIAKRMFRGKLFTGNRSTITNFLNYSHSQSILHIGTHAEVNNLSPDFSRLIFAKELDRGEPLPAHFLYTHQIYGHTLHSELTVLTACDTGKPNYRPGEGMISMAHAFRYAGSESMLASLWQIDEQSSAVIMESFYRYISQGMNKAEALQLAKLDYLQTARGRTLAPVYWAGITLIGDPGPMHMREPNIFRYWFWIFPIIFAMGLLIRKYFPMKKSI